MRKHSKTEQPRCMTVNSVTWLQPWKWFRSWREVSSGRCHRCLMLLQIFEFEQLSSTKTRWTQILPFLWRQWSYWRPVNWATPILAPPPNKSPILHLFEVSATLNALLLMHNQNTKKPLRNSWKSLFEWCQTIKMCSSYKNKYTNSTERGFY